MAKERKYRTLQPTGIENRLKSLMPTVTEMSDLEMVTFLNELADRLRAEAISEVDPVYRQGLVDEAASLNLISERLIDLVDYLDQGTLKSELAKLSEA